MGNAHWLFEPTAINMFVTSACIMNTLEMKEHFINKILSNAHFSFWYIFSIEWFEVFPFNWINFKWVWNSLTTSLVCEAFKINVETTRTCVSMHTADDHHLCEALHLFLAEQFESDDNKIFTLIRREEWPKYPKFEWLTRGVHCANKRFKTEIPKRWIQFLFVLSFYYFRIALIFSLLLFFVMNIVRQRIEDYLCKTFGLNEYKSENATT